MLNNRWKTLTEYFNQVFLRSLHRLRADVRIILNQLPFSSCLFSAAGVVEPLSEKQHGSFEVNGAGVH